MAALTVIVVSVLIDQFPLSVMPELPEQVKEPFMATTLAITRVAEACRVMPLLTVRVPVPRQVSLPITSVPPCSEVPLS